jgi:predicted PurR-regulated permease PerM
MKEMGCPRAGGPGASGDACADAQRGAGVVGPAVWPRPVRYSIYLIALVLGAASLYVARDFFVPITLAFLLALLLSPIVRAGQRRGIPHGISAVTLVGLVAIGLFAGLLAISAPAARWIEQTPEIAEQLEFRLQDLRRPVEAVSRASESVEDATDTGTPQTEVVVKPPSLLSRIVDNVTVFFATTLLSLLLTGFMLASSDLFYRRVVEISPTFSAKKHALTVINNIESEVSRYLLTITAINIALGVAIGVAMWGIGLPTPYLWGVVAALLNFIPYIGMLVGALLVGAVALVTFDGVLYAMLAPMLYLLLSSIEGGIITPVILGRRLAINTVAILLAIAFWGWLWGVVGVLIAVPVLVVGKVVCDHVAALAPLGILLGVARGHPGRRSTVPRPAGAAEPGDRNATEFAKP